jgi:hypothetical protein
MVGHEELPDGDGRQEDHEIDERAHGDGHHKRCAGKPRTGRLQDKGAERTHGGADQHARQGANLCEWPILQIARVDGHALGGGFALTLRRDYRLAVDDDASRASALSCPRQSDTASLFQPEIRAASRRAPTPQTVTSALTSEDRRERVKAMYQIIQSIPQQSRAFD